SRASRPRDLRRRDDLRGRLEPRARISGQTRLGVPARLRGWGSGVLCYEDDSGACDLTGTRDAGNGDMSEPTLFSRSAEPLAARMRPKSLDEFLGQEHLLGPGKALGELIRRGDVGSCIFWGPPGSGKTTLARLIANYTARPSEPCSAVTEGVARVREIIKEAEERLKYEGRGTILFCDEIHRFNR